MKPVILAPRSAVSAGRRPSGCAESAAEESSETPEEKDEVAAAAAAAAPRLGIDLPFTFNHLAVKTTIEIRIFQRGVIMIPKANRIVTIKGIELSGG